MKTKNKILSAMVLGLIMSSNVYANDLNEIDIEKAKGYCEENYGAGCQMVGLIYKYGNKQVKKDLFQSFKYYKKACKLDMGNSCAVVAEMYMEGKGVRKDIYKGYEYVAEACDLGVDFACKYYSELPENTVKMINLKKELNIEY